MQVVAKGGNRDKIYVHIVRKMVVCCCSTQIIIESTALKHRMNFYCLVCRKIRHRGHNLTQLEVSFELRDKEFLLYSRYAQTHHQYKHIH